MRSPLALLAVGLLAGCSTLDDPPAASPAASVGDSSPDTGAVLEPPRVPYEFRTSVTDAGYEHARLDAATQATIVWENAGTQTHSVVSDDGAFPGSGPI